jgi:hypothetical protein
MLKERIEDRWLLWLIKKWLKAGVLEDDGQVIHPATGTPQPGAEGILYPSHEEAVQMAEPAQSTDQF